MLGTLRAQHNLDTYISTAKQNSNDLEALRSQIGVTKLQSSMDTAQINAWQVSLTANYVFTPFFNNGSTFITSTPRDNAVGYDAGITNGGLYAAQINVEKRLFNGNDLDVASAKNSLGIQDARNSILLLEHTLERDVTLQYLDCLGQLRALRLAEEMIRDIQQQVNWIENLTAQGQVKMQDALLLRMDAANLQMSKDEALRSYRSALQQLNIACGIFDTALVYLDDADISTYTASDNSRFLAHYGTDSLIEHNKYEQFSSRYLPQVTLFGNTGLNAVELNGIERKFGLSAGLNFSLPLLDGNQKSMAYQQSEINKKLINSNRAQMASVVQAQRDASGKNISAYKASLANIQSQLTTWNTLFANTIEQLKAGNLSVIEFLALKKNYYDLKKNEIDTRINLEKEKTNLNYWNW
jgi:outer membrane protein TolC